MSPLWWAPLAAGAGGAAAVALVARGVAREVAALRRAMMPLRTAKRGDAPRQTGRRP